MEAADKKMAESVATHESAQAQMATTIEARAKQAVDKVGGATSSRVSTPATNRAARVGPTPFWANADRWGGALQERAETERVKQYAHARLAELEKVANEKVASSEKQAEQRVQAEQEMARQRFQQLQQQAHAQVGRFLCRH